MYRRAEKDGSFHNIDLINRKQSIRLNQRLQFFNVKNYIWWSARIGVGPSAFTIVYQWHVYISSNYMSFVNFADDATIFASDSDISNVLATVYIGNW